MIGRFSRRLGLGALGVAALAISTGSALAARTRAPSSISYKVVYAGSGTYTVNHTSQNAQNDEYFDTENASFNWKFTYPLTIRHPAGPPFGLGRRISGGGEWSVVASTNFGGAGCSNQGQLDPASQGSIESRMQHGGAVIINLVPGLGVGHGSGEDFSTVGGSSSPSGPSFCQNYTDFWGDLVYNNVTLEAHRSLDPLTAIVQLSPAQQRRRTVVFHVSNASPATKLTVNSDCGSGSGHTCTQSFQWKGTVTVTRTKPR